MEAENKKGISINLDIAAKLNFACHQNAYPILRNLRIDNLSESDRFESLTVTLTANPSFIKPKIWRVDRLVATGSVSISDRDVELDGGFLLKLAESMRGSLSLRVECNGICLAEESRQVELLAYNEWGGSGFMPELLAAFSMPNDPSVDRILREASSILRRAGKKDSIEGYQSGSRQRVWEIVSAIYAAIANLDLTYSEPPASFESDGQKIRTPGQIMDGRVATCLDTTLLFASAIEQAGLNPVIVMPKGHALVGVWLQPEELSTIVIHEAETLRKRVQLKELVLIETTFVASSTSPPFSKAISAALLHVDPKKDISFSVAIDIKRARMHKISPLGLKTTNLEHAESEVIPEVKLTLEEAPLLPDFDANENDDAEPETPQGRLERWQRRLLDLTLRNPLLNHRSTKSSLVIICPEPGRLEDKLAEGARLAIQAVPQPTTQAQDSELFRRRSGDDLTEEYVLQSLERKQILVDLSPDELDKRAVEIYRKTQTALQEGGSNTLYLAMGFLLWKRDNKDDKRFMAPLILHPVSLERKSVRSGIKLYSHDDEPRFNTTLLEMLRKDFSIDIKGLDGELPTDESGIDVNGVWNTVRKAVKEVPGFEVIEDVVLGHFSFAKYLMWKDLVDRSEALKNSRIVRHLIETPRDPYPSEIGFVEQDSLDRDYAPSDLLVPLSADASQMSAIATAELGKDFIIIGPPGTGKSQSISNMIAHLLGKGKTVLFVSEKTAALEVVYRRLDEVGLGRFCLELHSNKAKKTDVLNQLRDSWESASEQTVDAWKAEAVKLRTLRDRLNKLVDHLHMKRRNGLSAHYAIGVKIRDEDLAKHVKFTWPDPYYHDASELDEMRDAVEMVAIQAEAIGDISNSPFGLVETVNWSPHWESSVVEQAGQLADKARIADDACDKYCKTLGLTLPDKTIARVDALAELAAILMESYRKQTSYALEPDGPDRIEMLEEAVIRLKSYADNQAALSCSYDPMAWRTIDGEALAKKWNETDTYWWLKKYLARRTIIKEMQKGGARGKPNPPVDAPLLEVLRKEGEAIDKIDKGLSGFKDWQGHVTDPQSVKVLSEQGRNLRLAISKLADDANSLVAIKGKIRTLLYDGNDLLEPGAVIAREGKVFLDALADYLQLCNTFESITGGNVRENFLKPDTTLESVRNTVLTIASRHSELRDWCAWRKRRLEAIDLDLLPLVNAFEQGNITAGDIPDVFIAAYCTWFSGALLGKDDVLRTFASPEHNALIHKFREIDSHFQKLTSEYIAAKLSSGLPDSEDVKKSSQWGILRREIQKKTRHKPVRQLATEIPDVLTSLAPCLMMSPLSVAQYLPPDQKMFDVVIFDEASQITVWDAVGAIARGKQVIVAGDPKQMPPTNFFARADEDPDGEIDQEGDLESILDEMLGASIPRRTLNLHYRSRKESLIAFSNAKYYENQLITFPAPITPPDRGVTLTRPSGYYARGKARHNEGEAKAIVAEVVRRLVHASAEDHKSSIGIVTFNSEQQSLILDLLDEARSKHPEIEWAFSTENVLEPVFVKNLETVQGDERDVILFSITYGPDQSDHVTMNFGPLNRVGGERRLNVALTRARSEMMVFSTLHPDRIDLSRSQAAAVADLKHFLEYAERGTSVLGAFIAGSIGDYESPFEIAVARALKEKGWNVFPQIGVSAYRIDLGIVHPDEPGIYLAGVECDGAMYHSSAYARERDKIRQSVLEGLGWTLLRVWSTDWWTNKAKALEIIDSKLKGELVKSRDKRQKNEQNTGTEVILNH